MTQIDEPNLDEQIDDRISSYGIHDKTCGVTITYDLGNCDCQHLELKALIATQMQEARIDEIKRMREGMTFAHMTPSIYAAERIKNILGEVEL